MKSILLIGLGRFGKHIAMHLNHLGHQVMAVDTSEERVEDVLPIVTNAQIGDSTNADFLESLGVRRIDNNNNVGVFFFFLPAAQLIAQKNRWIYR